METHLSICWEGSAVAAEMCTVRVRVHVRVCVCVCVYVCYKEVLPQWNMI